MVRNANLFAEKCLGRSAVPPLARDEVAKMGLAGLEGINAVDSGPSEAEPAAAAADEEVQYELKVVVNKREMAPVLQKETNAAEKAIKALSEEAVLALQAALNRDGSAQVAGEDGAVFKILGGWLDAKMVPIVKKPLSRVSSSASFKAMERNMSKSSLCDSEVGFDTAS